MKKTTLILIAILNSYLSCRFKTTAEYSEDVKSIDAIINALL